MTDRTVSGNIEYRVREEAADWFVRVNADDAPLEAFQGWQQWLGSSPLHQRAYREIEETWQAWERIPGPPWPIDENRAELSSTADGERGSLPEGVARRRRASVALVAGVIGIAILVAALFLELPQGRMFARSAVLQTSAGENREFVLADGTRVAVGAATLITTDLNASTRTVIIDHGEAFFEVARERRPFIVRAGSGTITALGTAFNVHYVEGRVVVTVTEGRVEVTKLGPETAPTIPAASEPHAPRPAEVLAVRIGAGEQATYGPEPMTVQSANVELAKAWQAGQLRYIAEPLEYVLPDVSRYTRTQLIYADEAVGDHRYTGTILQDDVDHWLQSLEEVFPIRVVRLDENTVLLESTASEDR